jgi:hypothetical protein
MSNDAKTAGEQIPDGDKVWARAIRKKGRIDHETLSTCPEHEKQPTFVLENVGRVCAMSGCTSFQEI